MSNPLVRGRVTQPSASDDTSTRSGVMARE